VFLRDMLSCAGYGRSEWGKKLGEGVAPVGWPAKFDWSKLKGSTRSGLKIDEVTSIIISMLQARDAECLKVPRPTRSMLKNASLKKVPRKIPNGSKLK
jgi:hypothetical protein